jgi:hypothetical protein
VVEKKLLDGAPVTLTLCAVSLIASSGSTRVVLNNLRPSGNGSLSVPWMVSDPTRTSEIFVLIEKLLELAVRNGLDLRTEAKDTGSTSLREKRQKNTRRRIDAFALRAPWAADTSQTGSPCPVGSRAEKSQEAPNRRGLCAGGLLVEHAAFARQATARLSERMANHSRRFARNCGAPYGTQLPAI